MNSWNAGPGEMPWDDDRFEDSPRPNDTCSDCRRRFCKRPDEIGSLCDRCAYLQLEQQRRRNDEIYCAAVRNWFRRTDGDEA